jgi:hypothetical protein
MDGNLYGREWGTDNDCYVGIVDDTITFRDTTIEQPDVVSDIEQELDSGRDVLIIYEPDECFVQFDQEFYDQVLVEGGSIVAIIDDEGNVVDLDGEERGVAGDYLIVVREATSCTIEYQGFEASLASDGSYTVVKKDDVGF